VRILIVDDQRHTRRGLRALLSAEIPGAEILEGVNGAEAGRIAAEDPPPALVIMDLRMPVMDGITATRLIKERRPTVPIIVHSMDAHAAGAAADAGADAFAWKGGDPQDLVREVRRLLALSRR
jgi:DNA-binding NarL/FixJ family response regulator